MALIMYLTKAPKIQDLTTGEYKNIPFEDIALVDKYFNRQRAKEMGRNVGNTFKDWCGISEDKLPDSWTISYLSDFYAPKTIYNEQWGETETYSIFDQLARIVKANQIFRWFIENVMEGKPDQNYHEVTRDQLIDLFVTCRRVKRKCKLIGNDELRGDQFCVDAEFAKEYLPLIEERGLFFGTDEYGSVYATDVIDTFYAIKNILDTTDFEKETVYFNAIW
jgi:hypothetical protein